MRISTNNTKTAQYGSQVIYPDLSYKIIGIAFETHKEIGFFGREKQYGDSMEKKLIEKNLSYQREVRVADSGNILDFVIDRKIILELKSVRSITKEHYRQIQNYLQQSKMKLGILINFRQKFLKPLRIIRIDN